uniref:Uncharacterized protein n=1 Tax=Rheinheimera sp. BAL341 TaxID=1708203 RepID=A0A486XUU6_9GAMM
MTNKEPKVSFIKPSRPLNGPVKLDRLRQAHNIISKIETTVFVDANILISMEKVMKKGGKYAHLKEHGLQSFVRFLNSSPQVGLSPGLGLTEMPPERAAFSQEAYEAFCKKFLSGYLDATNATQVKFSGRSGDYGFFDIGDEFKALIAVSFASFIYLFIIDSKPNKDRLAMYASYLALIEENVGVLSHMEVQIARFCLSEPLCTSITAVDIRRKLRANFIKYDGRLPRSVDDVLKIAFNAACDIRLINTANIIDQNGVDGVNQDCWIATQDAKLALLCDFVYHTNLDGEVGKYAVSEIIHDDESNPYWKLSEEVLISRLRDREANGRKNFPTDPDALVRLAFKAIEDLKTHFR